MVYSFWFSGAFLCTDIESHVVRTEHITVDRNLNEMSPDSLPSWLLIQHGTTVNKLMQSVLRRVLPKGQLENEELNLYMPAVYKDGIGVNSPFYFW